MSTDSLGFSGTEALLYLCVSRSGRGWLSKTLVGLTALTGVVAGLFRFLAG